LVIGYNQAMLSIRPATPRDWPRIWSIFQAVVAAGDSFAWTAETTEHEAKQLWMSTATAYVAESSGQVVGAYFIKPNQPGRGSHVANAAYMVDPNGHGLGVGRSMGEHSLAEARAAGYVAMQFNLVVSTNERAVRLWRSLGFEILATLPQAFRHQGLGLVDAYLMHRSLA